MSLIEFDQFRFDPTDGRLSVRDGDDEIRLRPQAAALLETLLADPNAVIDRETLYRAVWGEEKVVDFEAGLSALIRELRQAFERLGGRSGLIETIPRRGYRLQAVIERADPPSAGHSGNDSRPSPPERDKTRSSLARRHVLAWGAVVAVVIAAVFLAPMMRPATVPGADPSRPHALAILPLERFGDAAGPGVNPGILLADNLLAELWKADLQSLDLIGRAGMRPYAGREDVAAAVAEALGVDLLIEGSIRSGADGWRTDVRLLSIPPGRVVWSQTLFGSDPKLPTGQVAARLVEQLAADWPELRRDLGR